MAKGTGFLPSKLELHTPEHGGTMHILICNLRVVYWVVYGVLLTLHPSGPPIVQIATKAVEDKRRLHEYYHRRASSWGPALDLFCGYG